MHSELPSIEDILLHKVVDVVFKGGGGRAEFSDGLQSTLDNNSSQFYNTLHSQSLYSHLESIRKIWKEQITLSLKGICVLLQLKEFSGRPECHFWRMHM